MNERDPCRNNMNERNSSQLFETLQDKQQNKKEKKKERKLISPVQRGERRICSSAFLRWHPFGLYCQKLEPQKLEHPFETQNMEVALEC